MTVTAAVDEKTYDGLTNNAAVTLSAPELIAGDDVQFDKVTGTYVTADAGDAENRRRARRNGAADRQLISVADDSKGADKHAKK